MHAPRHLDQFPLGRSLAGHDRAMAGGVSAEAATASAAREDGLLAALHRRQQPGLVSVGDATMVRGGRRTARPWTTEISLDDNNADDSARESDQGREQMPTQSCDHAWGPCGVCHACGVPDRFLDDLTTCDCSSYAASLTDRLAEAAAWAHEDGEDKIGDYLDQVVTQRKQEADREQG